MFDVQKCPRNSCITAPDKDGWEDSCSKVYEEEYLYDLQVDLYEKTNLVGNPDYREVCVELADVLKRNMAEEGEKIPEIL